MCPFASGVCAGTRLRRRVHAANGPATAAVSEERPTPGRKPAGHTIKRYNRRRHCTVRLAPCGLGWSELVSRSRRPSMLPNNPWNELSNPNGFNPTCNGADSLTRGGDQATKEESSYKPKRRSSSMALFASSSSCICFGHSLFLLQQSSFGSLLFVQHALAQAQAAMYVTSQGRLLSIVKYANANQGLSPAAVPLLFLSTSPSAPQSGTLPRVLVP